MDMRAIFRRLGSPSAIYLFANALTRLGAFGLIPLYVRRLDGPSYGDYILAQTILSLAPAFALGMPMAIARFYFDAKDVEVATRRFGGVARWTLAIALLMGLLAAVGIRLLPDGVGIGARRSMLLLDVGVVGSAAYALPQQFTRNTQRPVVTVVFQLAEFALLVGSGLYFVAVLDRGLGGALEALSFTYALLGGISAIYVFSVIPGSFSLPLLRESLALALPYVPHFLAQWVQSAADRWALKIAGQDADVGTYGLASQIAAVPQMVVGAWYLEQSAVTGESFRAGGLSTLLAALGPARRKFAAAALFPALLIVLSIPLLRVLVPRPAVFVYVPMILAIGLVDALYYPHQLVLYYAGKSRLLAGASIANAIVSLVCVWLLVPPLGLWGAVLSRLGSSLTRTGVVWLASVKLRRTPSE